MKLTNLLAPKLDLKVTLRLVFFYLVFTAVLLNGAALTFQSATSMDLGIRPRSAWASVNIEGADLPTVVIQAPEVTPPAPPYIILGLAN